jgi:HEPN domain-containing protein
MDRLAEPYLKEASIRLKSAERAFNEGFWAYCMRQSQECVELSLKAALRLVAIEYPKIHDISYVLTEERNRFPEQSRGEIEELAEISSTLSKMRGPSMYGDEMKGLPPEELFKRGDAEYALKGAEKSFNWAKNLQSSFKSAQV